jgi:hypothetical protein
LAASFQSEAKEPNPATSSRSLSRPRAKMVASLAE